MTEDLNNKIWEGNYLPNNERFHKTLPMMNAVF